MIAKIEDRKILVLYATSLCNLKCRYCYIEKSNKLQKIDKILEECFESDYFVDLAKEVFPNREQVEKIEIWGGEPTLALDRISPTIAKLLKYYPNVSCVMLSTNFVTKNCARNLINFAKVINSSVEKPVTFEIQISFDGPKSITDFNRGCGVTVNIVKSFSELISICNDELDDLKNITIFAHNKSTLDIDNIKILQSKDKLKEYFDFLFSFGEAAKKCHARNFNYTVTIPNCARPQPVTKQAGEEFANMCKLCRELNEEKRYSKIIVPFFKERCDVCEYGNCGNCGGGRAVIGLLPNRLITCCHDGFTELCRDEDFVVTAESSLTKTFFKDRITINPMVISIDKLMDRGNFVSHFHDFSQKNMTASLVGEIQLLASTGYIEPKYNNMDEALEASLFIFNHTCYCVRDNWNVLGTQLLIPPDTIVMFLNGAREVIQDAEREYHEDL